ncbi:MAG: hypothetical protein LN417_01150 [Candidatus Thermoplasmatota archaeon]|nr:hypothetical protein [Candidatus Thermoplasmatota archaeon]
MTRSTEVCDGLSQLIGVGGAVRIMTRCTGNRLGVIKRSLEHPTLECLNDRNLRNMASTTFGICDNLTASKLQGAGVR